ncbi:DUF2637 domain-containing protein [Streptomyces sp. NBC_00239]|uniref:DUF2637 domain-containing protein n=1 Tax=Streptomyces sp. NBC_00239 TaxID=2903640 RepID=UPI002E28ADCF|nr:DUF2637 domain-containing protein [Streptomyces sp. NBC_00239]
MKARLARLVSRIRRDVDPVLLQAVIAAALSFAHIHDVAHAAGQTGWKAWAYPVSVDLLMMAAWRRTRSGESGRVGRVGAWFWFAVALTASVGANVATAGLMDLTNPPAYLRLLVAGWPAIALCGGALLFHTRRKEAPEVVYEEPPLAAEEPEEEASEEGAMPSVAAPQKPVLVTYADAAQQLGVAEPTVRGAANSGRIAKHPAATPGRVLVDLAECYAKLRHGRTVGA